MSGKRQVAQWVMIRPSKSVISRTPQVPMPDVGAGLKYRGTFGLVTTVGGVLRWSWLLVVFGFAAGCGGGLGSPASVDCVGSIIVDGVVYVRDTDNDARLGDEDLGESFGEVDGTYDCGELRQDVERGGISGLSGLEGDQVWTVGGQTSESMLAVETDWGIRVYRSAEVSPLDAVLEGDIGAIGINSEFDGETRLATIDDPVTVERLVGGLVDAESVDVRGGDGLRYFIEFEHQGALVTVVPFFVSASQLGDRVVSDEWSAEIEQALSNSPDGETIDGITLEGTNGTGTFRPLGACRQDRVDLEVTPGELLLASTGVTAEAIWWLNPALPSQASSTGSAQIGSLVVVPNFDGSIILEVGLFDGDGNQGFEGCLTLGSTGQVPAPRRDGDRVPTGTLDCREGSGEGEGSGAEYQATEATNFDTPAEAVANWQSDPTRVDTFGSSRLTAVLSEFTSVVDLVSDNGSVEASLLLSNNGIGWFVRTESLCPPPDGSG